MVKFKDLDLKELLQLMETHGVSEISLKEGKFSVEVKRGNSNQFINPVGGPASNREITRETQAPPPAPEPEDDYELVKAPLVGTFYRASTPESDPYVEVGDNVKTGDILCIIEAMKSMNEIHTEVEGVIKEICVPNAELVEFEQPLFKITPKE